MKEHEINERVSRKPSGLYMVIFDIGHRYSAGTNVEASLLGVARKDIGGTLSDTWRKDHGKEIDGLLSEKYLLSQRIGKNCGLIKGTREYFNNQSCLDYIAKMVLEVPENGDNSLNLSEFCVIVKEGEEKKIFIPNISISQTRSSGGPVQHDTIDSFIAGISFLDLRIFFQYLSANQDLSLPEEVKNNRFRKFLELYGAEAKKRFIENIELRMGDKCIEATSPDEMYKDLMVDGQEYIPLEKRNFEVVKV